MLEDQTPDVDRSDVKEQSVIRNLLEKQAIAEVLVRYCRAIDRCDIELLKTVYWPDATENHGVFNGNALAFADFVIPRLLRMRATSHCLSNQLIHLRDQRAVVESYVTARHEREGSQGWEDYVVGGRYLDLLECRNGEWRILRRQFVEDWNQIKPSTPRRGEDPGDKRTFGGRWPKDASYQSHFTDPL
jgi:hypothetical protein